jgi:hypothetical protein
MLIKEVVMSSILTGLALRTALAVLAMACLQLSTGPQDAVAQPAPPDLQLLTTSTARLPNGSILRTFAGRAAPTPVLQDPNTGQLIYIYSYFPNPNDPFAINGNLQLGGNTGFGLQSVDRALSGVIPSPANKPWAFNMVPFGIALDGSIIDPSGPWYDGGAPDPNNPFDRKCSGWEYEVVHPTVGQLVGVPPFLQAHVQPGGIFHYHGYPKLLINALRQRKAALGDTSRPTLAGFSGDGYPIVDHVVGTPVPGAPPTLFLFSGYVQRMGTRAAQSRTNPSYTPSGQYDGLYVQDYVFDPQRKHQQIQAALAQTGEYLGLKAADLQAGRATYALLDVRNGIILRGPAQILPGYPPQHYAYVLTPDWPQTPRVFAFEPDNSFKNIIPFSKRRALYDNCSAQLKYIHVWENRVPY